MGSAVGLEAGSTSVVVTCPAPGELRRALGSGALQGGIRAGYFLGPDSSSFYTESSSFLSFEIVLIAQRPCS